MLEISTDKVCFIIARAREFHVKQSGGMLDAGSNPTDQDIAFSHVLENQQDDPNFQELVDAIDGLDEGEKIELVALTWIGRGDYDRDGYQEAMREARDRYDGQTARYLVGMPLLATYLEEGLNSMGFSCADVERDRL